MIGNLYQGIGNVLESAIPAATTFFTVYSTCRMHGTGDWIAALMGEFTSTTIRQPLEVLKQRSQVGMNSFQSPYWHPFGLSFKGYTVTLMRDLPFALISSV